MGRFHGEVGYASSVEVRPGYWKEVIEENTYFGDYNRGGRRFETAESVNPNLTISNTIRIVADDNLLRHYSKIRYVRWEGARWKVTSVEVSPPRLILRLGEVYNGQAT